MSGAARGRTAVMRAVRHNDMIEHSRIKLGRSGVRLRRHGAARRAKITEQQSHDTLVIHDNRNVHAKFKPFARGMERLPKPALARKSYRQGGTGRTSPRVGSAASDQLPCKPNVNNTPGSNHLVSPTIIDLNQPGCT